MRGWLNKTWRFGGMEITPREMAWSLYDFSNSAYALMIMTLFFPIYFSRYVQVERSELWWGVAVSGSVGLVGLVSPFVGAYADRHGVRKRLFLVTSLASVAGTMLLPLTATIGGFGGMAAFMAVNFSFGLALFLYDSFLVVVPQQHETSTSVSGFGWGLGFAGGLIALVACLAPLGFQPPRGPSDFNIIFFITGLFFLLFSLVPYRMLPPDVPTDRPSDFRGAFRRGAFRAVFATVRHSWPNKKLIFLFMAAMYFIQDGLTTVVYFTAIYAQKGLHFSDRETLILIVLSNAVAVVMTAVVCRWGDFKGEVPVLLGTSVVWTLVVVLISVVDTPGPFYVIAAITGTVLGSTPALARGYLSKLVPSERRAELFGFNSFASRIASLLGPTLFGALSQPLGMRGAMLVAVLPFFLIGALLMIFVWREDRKVFGKESR